MVDVMCNRRGGLILPFLLLFFSIGAYAQMNISGKPGLIYIPSAWAAEESSFSFGYKYNPVHYAFRQNRRRSESIYHVNLAFLPRLEINLNLLRMNGDLRVQDRGIGDRQLDIKYLLLKETSYRPALSIILSAPFGIDNSFSSNAIVASKTIPLLPSFYADVTVGYGSPYYILREESEKTNFDIFSNLQLRKKKELRYRYLSGPLAGLNVRYGKKGGLLVEWDSQHLNLGAYAMLWKRWTMQAALLNGDQVTFGTSYIIDLTPLPKRLRTSDETK
ncbi:hypothetical protein HNQ92_004849 [Rhabdobacter roseus]|uniref:YjbH domain-containing protein n=1 Tax=Rhabdobacter roseus TaxID=1655419 RepID=A0A840U2W5_9BACT|nr:YjbH domain-containing protein [Rhabdobacter roseus]MBB5286688.1 hypothetical protein [Rhabdobacter roseus]